jgi:hypothetical protein
MILSPLERSTRFNFERDCDAIYNYLDIYRQSIIDGHFLPAKDRAMPMTLTLTDSAGNQYFDYQPQENQWWITAFDPSPQNVRAENLISTTTIDRTG